MPTSGACTRRARALACAQFVKRHVRMRDVRLYIRDVLREYAALQKFKPKPGPGVGGLPCLP